MVMVMVCLSVCLSVSVSLSLFLCLSVCLSVCTGVMGVDFVGRASHVEFFVFVPCHMSNILFPL